MADWFDHEAKSSPALRQSEEWGPTWRSVPLSGTVAFHEPRVPTKHYEIESGLALLISPQGRRSRWTQKLCTMFRGRMSDADERWTAAATSENVTRECPKTIHGRPRPPESTADSDDPPEIWFDLGGCARHKEGTENIRLWLQLKVRSLDHYRESRPPNDRAGPSESEAHVDARQRGVIMR